MNYWPDGMKVQPIVEWPGELSKRRGPSNFSSTLSSTMETLRRELRELRAKDVILQIAIPREAFRIDGYPRATAKPSHPGVILTLQSQHGPLSYPCDTYGTWQENLRAIALALEALRKVDRYGVTKRGEQYRGFLAIEGGMAMPPAWTYSSATEFLWTTAREDVADNPISTREVIRLAKRYSHPDTGGDAETFQRVLSAETYLAETSNA